MPCHDPARQYGGLYRQILDFTPRCPQEEADRFALLGYLKLFPNLLTRQNPMAHLTASAWIVNPGRDRVLLVYHSLYRSWSWTGGHLDGDRDPLFTALREAREETGLTELCPAAAPGCAAGALYSLEVLPVWGHVKRGEYLSTHLHLNLTYLLEAREDQPLRPKPDENSGVAWFALEEVETACTEPEMRPIYQKLSRRL